MRLDAAALVHPQAFCMRQLKPKGDAGGEREGGVITPVILRGGVRHFDGAVGHGASAACRPPTISPATGGGGGGKPAD